MDTIPCLANCVIWYPLTWIEKAFASLKKRKVHNGAPLILGRYFSIKVKKYEILSSKTSIKRILSHSNGSILIIFLPKAGGGTIEFWTIVTNLK